MSETTARADRVARLLEDPDLKQAFRDVRDAILRQFQEIPPSESEQLLKCRERLHLLDSLEANLKRAIQDGKLERLRVEEQKKPPFLGDLLEWRKKQRA